MTQEQDDGHRKADQKADSSANLPPGTGKGAGQASALQAAGDNAYSRAYQEACQRAQHQQYLMSQPYGNQQQLAMLMQRQLVAVPLSMLYAYAPKVEPIKHEGIIGGELVGWRCWRASNGFLNSLFTSFVWLPDVPMNEEGIPDIDNRVGIYAYKTCSSQLIGKGQVVGSVYLWGEVLETEDGYRAQYAAVRSIDGGVSYKELNKLRYNYGVKDHAYAIRMENEWGKC